MNLKIFYVIIIVTNVIKSEKISPLLNQTYLLTSSSHGLKILTHSTTYIFSGIWTQLVEIKFPSDLWKNNIPPMKFVNCSLIPTALTLTEICKTYNIMIKVLHETNHEYRILLMEKLTHLIRDQPLHQWFRNKRSIIPLIGDALSFLFGTAKDNDVKEVKANYNALLEEIKSNRKNTALLAKQLLGLSQLEREKTEKIKNALNEIGSHLKYLDEMFEKTWTEIYKTKISNDFSKDMEYRMNEALVNIITSIYDLSLLMNSIDEIDESLVQLRRGQLPVNLMPWKKLAQILKQISSEIGPLYELGIEDTQWQLYYNLALTKFSLIENGILIKLSVPIKTRNTQTKYQLLSPITSPIPCSSSFCRWYDRINSNDTFITLDIKDRLWVTDISYLDLFGEIVQSSINCLNIGNERLCYAFDRSLINPVSACTRFLWSWDGQKITEFCKFEISLQENYYPIQITPDLYMLHKQAVNSYDLICLAKGSKSYVLKHWCEEVVIETGCYLQTTNLTLYGPLKYRDSRLDIIKTETPNFLFANSKLEELKIEKSSSVDVYEETKFKKFGAEKVENILQLDQKALTAALNQMWISNSDHRSKINFLVRSAQHGSNSSTFNLIIDIICQFVLLTFCYLIALSLILKGNILFYISPIIISPNRVYGFVFNEPDYEMGPIETIVEQPFEPIIQLVMLILSVILTIIIYKIGTFRTIITKYHYGLYSDPNQMIDIANENSYFYISFSFVKNLDKK